jgi:hypothetical protein
MKQEPHPPHMNVNDSAVLAAAMAREERVYVEGTTVHFRGVLRTGQDECLLKICQLSKLTANILATSVNDLPGFGGAR